MVRDWKFIAAVAVLTLVTVVRVASTHRVFSATVDEPIHLACGYEWFEGELTTDMTHPPLARVLGAIPAPTLAIGMAQVRLHDISGRGAYVLGRESRTGWWYYFPVVLFYKSPLPWLILVGWGTIVLARARHRGGLQLVLIAAALLLVVMTASINIGAPHILPLLAPLSLVAGHAVVDIWRRSRDAFGRSALIALLAWLFIGVAIEHPEYLAWFNETARPNSSYFAADSNIDWGQDVLRLARVVEELKIDHLHAAFMNRLRLEVHGIRTTGLVPHQKMTGWVVVSENWLRFGESRGDYDWLRPYRPVRQVGKSIRLYYIP